MSNLSKARTLAATEFVRISIANYLTVNKNDRADPYFTFAFDIYSKEKMPNDIGESYDWARATLSAWRDAIKLFNDAGANAPLIRWMEQQRDIAANTGD